MFAAPVLFSCAVSCVWRLGCSVWPVGILFVGFPDGVAATKTMAAFLGLAALALVEKARWLPQRRAFGNCTWPPRASCPSGRANGGNALNELLGMYASWDACSPLATQSAPSHSLLEVARIVHPLSRWHEGFTTDWLPNRSGHAHRLPCAHATNTAVARGL